MKKVLFALILGILCGHWASAQSDSISSHVSLGGYVETYYGYDFGQPDDHNRPGFIYSHNRHNEVNLNLAMLKAAFQQDNIRANVAFMTGTYANANLAAEPGVLKNIYEANIGIRLSKKRNIWLDAGVFPSHIGFESAIGKDCKTLSRSILADNSPYYESGAKVTYAFKNGKWLFSGLILNGWQRIQRVNGNQLPALGHQITFKPSDRITLNSSSFVGNDSPEKDRKMRYFHNFYGQFQIHKKMELIVGFDAGMQQKAEGSARYDKWYTPVIIAYYSPSPKVSLGTRAEYFSDTDGVIFTTGTTHGFRLQGYSFNADYRIAANALWRVEARMLKSRDRIFSLDEKPSAQNYFFVTALCLSF